MIMNEELDLAHVSLQISSILIKQQFAALFTQPTKISLR